MPRCIVLGKFNSGTKIEKACKAKKEFRLLVQKKMRLKNNVSSKKDEESLDALDSNVKKRPSPIFTSFSQVHDFDSASFNLGALLAIVCRLQTGLGCWV